MRLGTPTPIDRAWIKGRALMVVDTWQPCECHQVIVAKGMDTPEKGWAVFAVILPVDIGFGDYLDYNQSNLEIHLIRGGVLRFKLHLGNMPPDFVAKVVADFPDDDSGNTNLHISPDPNGGPPDHEC